MFLSFRTHKKNEYSFLTTRVSVMATRHYCSLNRDTKDDVTLRLCSRTRIAVTSTRKKRAAGAAKASFARKLSFPPACGQLPHTLVVNTTSDLSNSLSEQMLDIKVPLQRDDSFVFTSAQESLCAPLLLR